MSYEGVRKKGAGLSIYDFESTKHPENRLYEIAIENRDVPVMAHTIAPVAKVYAPPDIYYTNMPPLANIPDGRIYNPDPNLFSGGIIIPEPSGEPPKDIETAITDILNNSWLLIVGGSIILLIIVCALALIYYFKKQKKSTPTNREPSVYRFNS